MHLRRVAVLLSQSQGWNLSRVLPLGFRVSLLPFSPTAPVIWRHLLKAPSFPLSMQTEDETFAGGRSGLVAHFSFCNFFPDS